MRTLQKFTSGGKLMLWFQWDYYRWPQRSPSRSKFKVKPNIPLLLAIRIWEIYKSLHLGVNRCCESNETNNDGLRGYTWGTWLVNPLRLDKIILEIILKVKVYGQIQISIFSCKNRLKFVKICILGELDMINQFLLVQMRLEVEFQSQCMMRRHKWLLYL